MIRIQQFASIFFLLSICVSGYAQDELNAFKYIIVPKKYDFQKSENQYRINSTTKYLFEQDGFNVLYQGDDYPEDLYANPCLAAKAIILNVSGAFTTKVIIALRDCRDQEVYRSAEGRSKIKEFDRTYIDAIKKSYVSIENLDYRFDETLAINAGITDRVLPQRNVSSTAMVPAAEASTSEVVSSSQKEPVSAESTEESSATKEVMVTEQSKEAGVNSSSQADPVTNKTVETGAAGVAVVPVAVSTEPEPKQTEETETQEDLTGGARAFRNETTTFLLIDQGNQMQAFVSESKNKNYKPGELIGTFKKTSLPNVFRVSWKKPQEGVESTTAYFDDKGNLKIDIQRSDKIEVISFSEVK